MPVPVALPSLAWGSPASSRRALLVHGLGSTGALMWRYATALADAGWYAVAVDLRGHGTAPRALDYTIAAYAADAAALAPADGGAWDLVLGHSLGGAAVTVAAAENPAWTRRLVLVDPALHLLPRDRAVVTRSQEQSFEGVSIEDVRAEHPHWHPQDHELKAQASQLASRWAITQTLEQNPEWDVRDAAAALAVPTHVIGSDPEVYSIFTGDEARGVLAANALITMSIVAEAGHSPHRDRPEATIDALAAVLA